MTENTINGLHIAFAICGMIVGVIIGFVHGWMAHKECEDEMVGETK